MEHPSQSFPSAFQHTSSGTLDPLYCNGLPIYHILISPTKLASGSIVSGQAQTASYPWEPQKRMVNTKENYFKKILLGENIPLAVKAKESGQEANT